MFPFDYIHEITMHKGARALGRKTKKCIDIIDNIIIIIIHINFTFLLRTVSAPKNSQYRLLSIMILLFRHLIKY